MVRQPASQAAPQVSPPPPPPPPQADGAPGDWRSRGRREIVALRPVWSRAAALRAVRATVVIPALFAVTDKVVGNPQTTLFATFGGVAMLILASFGGNRRTMLVSYLSLGVAGSVLLTIGTAVSSTTAVAAIVTVPVAFSVLFAGVIGPNAASGATAVLLTYVLPAASPGTIDMVPSRLAGWWLAVAAGTVAVLLLSQRPPANRLRAAAARSAGALSAQLDAVMAGTDPGETDEAASRARGELSAAFTAAPYRPTGVAKADQSLGRLVESLGWTTDLAANLSSEREYLATASPIDLRLLEESSRVLRDTAALLSGSRVAPSVAALDGASQASWDHLSQGRPGDAERAVDAAFHAQMIAAATRGVALDAIGASRIVTDDGNGEKSPARRVGAFLRPVTAPVRSASKLVRDHASVRSVWARNSARGAVALAGAVAAADLINVQHGFWVVLAALSVLRTSAGATGSTALRGIVGTAVGFFIGAGIIVAIGVGSAALWAAFPLAVMVAAYTPGTATFAVGQAAFTLELSVLYNLLVPVGWNVGVLRLEDVALGAGVSVVVGLLFWPRGAVAVLADDLADAYHAGGMFLTQSTSWTVGVRAAPPDATPSVRAEDRLEDAVRGMLAEQGTKHVPKEQVWLLVAGTLRLRQSAQALARFAVPTRVPDPTREELVREAVEIAGRCDDLSTTLGRPLPTVARELAALPAGAVSTPAGSPPIAVLVRHLLGHVRQGVEDMMAPAHAVGTRRAAAWWH